MNDSLPSSWALVRLADLGEWGSGGTPKRSKPEFYGGEIPWLKIGDLTDGFVVSAEESITLGGLQASSAKLLEANVLLVAMYGSIGKLGITRAQCATNQAIAFCRPESTLTELSYLFYLLRAKRSSLLALGQGGSQQNISQTILKGVEIPLAPLNEQRRIVAKIEALFERSRRAKEALDAIPALLDKLRQSILAAAFRGDLTADWRAQNPDVEPADKLLDRIRAERRRRWEQAELAKMRAKGREPNNDKWKAKYKEPGISPGGDLPRLPRDWTWTTLAALSWDEGYGTSTKCAYDGKGEPVLRIPNVRLAAIEVSDLKRARARLDLEDSHYLQPGDFLIVRTNGSRDLIGRAALVKEGSCSADTYFASYLIRFRLLGSRSLQTWIDYCWRSPWMRDRITRAAATSAGQYNVSMTGLADFPIPLPPETEIVAATTAATRLLQHLELLVGTADSRAALAAQLDKAILAKAFRGELVEQDPSDEPASVLLQRIRAARETGKPVKKKRQRNQIKVATARRPAAPRKAGPSIDRVNPARQLGPSFRLAGHDPEVVYGHLFAALWGKGPLDKDTAVRTVAAALRDQGFCDYKRLRKDGALYAEILTAIDRAVKAGHLDRPRRNHVRAVRPSAADYTTDDWRLALLAALGPDPTDRDEAIRAAAEWAGDNLGLEFKRLRSDGLIVKGLKSAINSGIRRGEVERCTGSTIRTASNGSTGD